jgi:very-short-patch-repair endonuclease
MPDIGTNEREFSSLLISWLNDILKTGGHEAKEASGETSVKDDKTLFPDFVLWKSRAENKALTLFELKNTTVHIDDKELLENAMIKAKNLACKYLVTWNVREAAIWDVSKGFPDLINKYPPLVNINSIQDIFIEQTKESLKRRAKEIVQDIDILIQSGKFRAHKLDPILFSAVLKDTVEHLTPEIHKALLHKYQSDKAFKNEFNKWAAEQGIQNYTDQEYFTSASKQIVYRVTGQILFYFALKRQIKSLPDLDISDFDVEKTKQILQDAFEEVRKIDYQAVYEPTLVDDIDWSQEAGLTLQALLKNLAYYDFSNMPLDVIGTVFEELIPPNEQHTLGQYFTPEDLVDFINGFVIQSKEDFVFDPTCGTGTFLVRAYNRFNHLFSLHDHEKLIERIWGNDIAAFPTELTAINLFIRKLDDANNYPRVIRKDFFEVNPGDEVEFPHPRLGIKGGYKMEVPVPMFDGMMGNFPYIRQELIEKAVPGYKKMLSETLAREWLAEYPELFEIPKHAMAGYQKWVESGFDEKMSGKLFEMVEVKLSGQADIYAYMFFHSAKFLKPGGRMAFLTSNSWLDVAYGYELQKFFAKKFKIVAIFESRCEPWFQSASVNTVVTVLERCDDPDEIANHPARFVKIKRKFEDLLPQEDLALEAQQRHIDVDRLVGVIEDETRIGKLIYAYCITEEGPHPKSFSQGEKDFNNLPSPSGRGTEGEGFSGRGTEGEGFSGRGTGGEGFSERGTEGEGFSVESEGSSFSGETSYRYSPKYIIDLARELSQKSNKPEEIMWYLLRDRRFHGLKFRRQHPIDRYIADFYCHEINLVIELDGLVHEEQFQKEYDENRDEYMKASGYNVLRIDADEVMNDCDNVLRLIEDEIIALSQKWRFYRGMPSS